MNKTININNNLKENDTNTKNIDVTFNNYNTCANNFKEIK